MGEFINQSCFEDPDQRAQVASDLTIPVVPVVQPGTSGPIVNAPTSNVFGDVTTNQTNTTTYNQFGTFTNKKYRIVKLDLSAKGSYEINIVGTVIVFHDAHDQDNNPVTSARMMCRLETMTAEQFTIRPGWTMSGNRVSRVYLEWPAHNTPVQAEIMILLDNPMDRGDVLV